MLKFDFIGYYPRKHHGKKRLNHYITIYGRDGKKYAASWIQLNIFRRCFCFSKKEKEIK